MDVLKIYDESTQQWVGIPAIQGDSGVFYGSGPAPDWAKVWIDEGSTPDVHTLPAGGSTGQALLKAADTSYETEWGTPTCFKGNTTRFAGGIQDVDISSYQTAGGYAFLLLVVDWVTFSDLAGLYLVHGIASGQYQGITTIFHGTYGPQSVAFNGTDKVRITYYNSTGGYWSIVPLMQAGA